MSTKWVSFIAAGILFVLASFGVAIGYLSTREPSEKKTKKNEE